MGQTPAVGCTSAGGYQVMLQHLRARLGGSVVFGEAQRIERMLAAARAFLAAASLMAIWLDPTEPGRYATFAYSLLVVYVIHSLLILVLVRIRRESSPAFRFCVHAIDVLWPALLSVFTTGPNSPFFVFNVFALLAAAYRWGFLETLATAGAAIVLFFSQALLMEGGPGPVRAILEGSFELNRFIIRSLYLLIAGYLLGFLGEEEKRLRAETAAIARLIARVQGEVGLRGALRVLFDELLHIFGAHRVLLALEQAGTGRAFLWEGTREAMSRDVAMSFVELNAEQRGIYLSDPPGQTWHAQRGDRPQGTRDFDLYVVSDKGKRLADVTWNLPEGFWAAHKVRSLLGAGLSYGSEWTGQLLLLDPSPGSTPGAAVAFLQAVAQQVGPAIYGVFLLRRLRSRVGAVERARVARELHDGVIQSLIGLEMQVDVLRRQPSIAGRVAEELDRIQQLLRREILNLRELMQQMKPVDLGPRQFLDFLATTVDRFGRDTGIAARFVSPLEEAVLPPRVCSEVARIVQEALVNVRKHSGARQVLVRFDSHNGHWRLVIDDDGRGFDFTGRLSQAELDAARKGPMVIKERVRSIGGELSIESGAERGARLEISIPQKAHG